MPLREEPAPSGRALKTVSGNQSAPGKEVADGKAGGHQLGLPEASKAGEPVRRK